MIRLASRRLMLLKSYGPCMSTFVSSHFKIDEGDVLEYLQRKKFTLSNHTTHFVLKECCFCPKPTYNKADNLFKLYISKGDGAYFCHRCGGKGSWFDFKKRLGDINVNVQSSGGPTSDSFTSSSSSKAVIVIPKPRPDPEKVKLASDNLLVANAFPEALAYLTKSRHLKAEVLKKYGVGAKYCIFTGRNGEETKELCVTFPWITVTPNNDRIIHRVKARSIENKHMQRLEPAGGEWGLFGLHTVPPGATSVVLTEGEYDAMAVFQSTGLPALSLPNGCRSLPLETLALLERFEKIYLWMDDDVPGKEGAEVFTQKLGTNRCVIVRSPPNSGAKDANDMLMKGLPMRPCIDSAKPLPHKEIVSFYELRHEILTELANPSQVAGVQSLTLPSLNRILKGHRRGELTIVTGATGAGKTTFLSQLSIDYARQGVTTLWGSFEIKNTRLIKKMLSQFSGVDLEKEISKFDVVSDQFSQLPIHYLRFFGSTNVDEVIDAMDYAVYVYDVQHIILDNLQFMMGSSGDTKGFERFDAQEKALDKFRKFTSAKNVHLTLVVHPRKENEDHALQISSVFGTAKATQEADNVIILQKIEGQKSIEIKKNRFDGELGSIPLTFDKGSLSYIEGTGDERESSSTTHASVIKQSTLVKPVFRKPEVEVKTTEKVPLFGDYSVSEEGVVDQHDDAIEDGKDRAVMGEQERHVRRVLSETKPPSPGGGAEEIDHELDRAISSFV